MNSSQLSSWMRPSLVIPFHLYWTADLEDFFPGVVTSQPIETNWTSVSCECFDHWKLRIYIWIIYVHILYKHYIIYIVTYIYIYTLQMSSWERDVPMDYSHRAVFGPPNVRLLHLSFRRKIPRVSTCMFLPSLTYFLTNIFHVPREWLPF